MTLEGELLYGNAYEERRSDGTVVRLDPTKIMALYRDKLTTGHRVAEPYVLPAAIPPAIRAEVCDQFFGPGNWHYGSQAATVTVETPRRPTGNRAQRRARR